MNAPNRLERRKQETRAALIGAAQQLVAAGRMDAPITTITDMADVGTGSFYNHFSTKEELFEAALRATMELLGDLLNGMTADIEDPAEAFATRYRLLGRLHGCHPDLSRVLLNTALQWVRADVGFAPRARRTLEAGIASGRFRVTDLEITYAIIAGSTICFAQLLEEEPDRDAATSVDVLVAEILGLLGIGADEATRICALPLPDLPEIAFAA